MRDTELYRHLLGIAEPFTVEKVDLNVTEQRVDVHVGHPDGVRFPCPECSELCTLADHSDARSWRHLDSCSFATYLHARPPRVECPTHGVLQVTLPWAKPNSRFTALFERLAIDLIKETSLAGAARILKISWDQAFGIMDRAVRRGLDAKGFILPEAIGIDEKAIAKRHKYLSLIYDLAEGTVEHVGDGRGLDALTDYFDAFTKQQLAGIRAVTMDMWPAFISTAQTYVPGAADKIVFDPFHVVKHMNDAVDKIRRTEHRSLRAAGDDSLTGSRYLWLYGSENLPEHRRESFEGLRTANLRTAKAYAIKESLRDFYDLQELQEATDHLKHWHFWATHSRLKPVIKVARMIRSHLRGVMNFFKLGLTNSIPESINNVIQTIKKRAHGFRNADHFKTAIFFHCGGLQLYPMGHGNV